MSDTFLAISDPTRRRILNRLRTQGSLSVTELAEPLSMTRQAVTKHLDVLEGAGLLEHSRQGRKRIHRLKAQPLEDVAEWLAPYAAAWDRRLSRLRTHLEEDDSK
jgi:DNA-binding transcriptional ArsR family regulator